MSAFQRLAARWDEGYFVCVGLDSDPKKLPKHLLPDWEKANEEEIAEAQIEFNKEIVDATKDIVCAYKPNLAFYRGAAGKKALRLTIAYIHKVAPGVIVILDAKQADIGNTNDGYVAEDFDWYGADAITVHPYLGMEAMKPFLERADKLIIVLCRTSNTGAGEFQDADCIVYQHREDHALYSTLHEAAREREMPMEVADPFDYNRIVMPLYRFVAYRVAQSWNRKVNCALVVGATWLDELESVRSIVDDMPILIPGLGAQGAEIEPTVQAGQTKRGSGMINNMSRAVIFASNGEDFAPAARQVVLNVNAETDKYRNKT